MKRYFYLRVKKLTTSDIVVMSLMLALYLVLNLVAGYSILPFFITLNLQFIPLFVLACYTDWLRTLIVVTLAGIIAFFMPANFDSAKPLAYLFDYFIPLLLVAVCSIFIPREYKPNLQNEEKDLTFWEKAKFLLKKIFYWTAHRWIFLLVITVYAFLSFWSKTFAGVLFYAEGTMQKNPNVWIGSMIINVVNSVFDWVLYLVTIPIICYTIYPVAKKF